MSKKAIALLIFFLVNNAFAGVPKKCIPNGEVDWPCVCHDLCRKGVGGILCNCDLAPF